MIKNIVFDIGRVLLDYQPEAFLAEMGLNPKDIDELNQIIFKNELWLKLDRGVVTQEEAVEAYCHTAPIHTKRIQQIMETWPLMLTPIEGTAELLKQLVDRGYNVYLLSNFMEHGFKYILNKFPFLSEVKGSVISWQVKMLKPEKEIYRYLLDKYDLLSEETVFIDDLKENIEAAIEIGMKGIVFKDADLTRLQLKNIDVDL